MVVCSAALLKLAKKSQLRLKNEVDVNCADFVEDSVLLVTPRT